MPLLLLLLLLLHFLPLLLPLLLFFLNILPTRCRNALPNRTAHHCCFVVFHLFLELCTDEISNNSELFFWGGGDSGIVMPGEDGHCQHLKNVAHIRSILVHVLVHRLLNPSEALRHSPVLPVLRS